MEPIPTPPSNKEFDRKESTERALESTYSDASVGLILETADIGIDDIKGKVLDIGSGEYQRFARDLKHFYKKDVVSIDPKLIYPSTRYNTKIVEPSFGPKSVAAIVQEMPIKSESIDTIFATASLQLLDPVDYPYALSEIYRVLSPGGKAYILPLFESNKAPYDEKEFFKCLESLGITYTVVEKPKPDGTFKVVTIHKPPSGT